MRYRVWMVFPDTSTYLYEVYDDKFQANETAMQVREELGIQTWVEEVYHG